MALELITHQPAEARCPTPILFVHGAWHGAWCWDEHFLPYFAAQGFPVHALSLRHHGESTGPGTLRGTRGADYVADVAEVVGQLGRPPVLVGHSLGGYVVQKYLEGRSVPAVVLLASVPPRGALGATLRTARRLPWAFLQTNLQRRLWPLIGSPRLTRDAFFAPDMPETEVAGYFARMQDESYRAYWDMLALNLPRPRRVARVPLLALGGSDDAIIGPGEVRATARTYAATGEVLPHLPHDLMLDSRWQTVADRMLAWLNGVPGLWEGQPA